MTKLKKYGLIIFYILFSTFFLSVEYLTRKETTVTDFNTKITLAKKYCHSGDIIFRSGTGFWSDLFRSKNSKDKRFSHVGVIKIIDDDLFVIHSLANEINGVGVVECIPIEDFIADSKEIGLARLKNIDPNIFLKNVETYLGAEFDWKFDKSNDHQIYCTELVYWSLKKINPDYTLKDIDGIIFPEACLDTNLFQEIELQKQP